MRNATWRMRRAPKAKSEEQGLTRTLQGNESMALTPAVLLLALITTTPPDASLVEAAQGAPKVAPAETSAQLRAPMLVDEESSEVAESPALERRAVNAAVLTVADPPVGAEPLTVVAVAADTASATSDSNQEVAAVQYGRIHHDGRGLRLSTPDERYYVRLAGYGQFAYQQVISGDDGLYQNGFRLRRLRPTLSLGIGDLARLDFEVNLGSKGVSVQTAMATIQPHSMVAIRIGQQKPLLNPEQSQSSSRMPFLERSYVSSFTPQRDIGLAIALTPTPSLEVELGVFNGADDGEVNGGFKNSNPEFQGRLRFSPTRAAGVSSKAGSLWIGVATSHGVVRDANKQSYLDNAGSSVSRRLKLSTQGGLNTNILRSDAFYDGPRTRVTAFAYGSIGGLRLMGEFLHTQTDLHSSAAATLATRSWNVVASYSFGAEVSHSGVTPLRGVEEGGLGALEIKARYHEALLWGTSSSAVTLLNVDPSGRDEARLRGASFGLAWIASRHVRLQADYHFTTLPDNLNAAPQLPGNEHSLQFGATIGL